ncbi:MAG: phosphodiester glycosidase family protein [Defluviitaleaceae bacterium]|nr:phosphodiester glycosidase family protein [Defluviitaleaceae bacterium]
MKKIGRKIILHTIVALVSAVVFFASTQAAYADVLFEHRESESLVPGVTYERVLRMTERGMLDIHVLLVPLDNPYIYIGPIASERELGLKETTTNLLAGTGAVAGINADFFGLAGNHSVHFGPMAMDGELLGLNTHTNHSRNEFATFFLDTNNNPFFEYIRADIRFYNNGARNFDIASLNVVGNELNFPVIVDRNLMVNTNPLLERFNGLVKYVVENNRITQVSRGMVVVPYNGYVFVLPGHMYESHGHLISLGDSTSLSVGNNLGIDFSRIQAAIGGGGLILNQGQTVTGAGVAPNARHPRSAIGVNRDGNQLILMVVDGRSHSIGATQNEMADLLRSFGAWDAMHFDGGGSSTMVLRKVDGSYTVANTPSDGAQRRIINALGVFDSRPFEPTAIYIHVPQMAELRANPTSVALFGSGQTATLRFSGIAADGNHVSVIPVSAVEFTVVPSALGTVENGVFTAGSGYGHIVASVNGINTYIPVTIGGEPQPLNILGAGRSFVGYPAAYVSGEVTMEASNIRLDYDFAISAATQAAHVSLYPPVALPAGTIALNLEVRGNNSGHWLRGRVRDGAGRHHNIDFTNNINFNNWDSLTALLPSGVSGPFVLDRIYVVALSSTAAARHTLQFGRMETIVAPPIPTNVPQGPVFRDWMWAQRGFAGVPAGNNVSFALPYSGAEVEYDVRSAGGFAAVTMTLYGGRLGTDQWRNFLSDIRSTNPSNVVILMDDNPQRAFRHAMEFELFHLALEELIGEGRNVFVVSNTGANTAVVIRNGVRYINLAQGRNEVHFRTYGTQIWWTD